MKKLILVLFFLSPVINLAYANSVWFIQPSNGQRVVLSTPGTSWSFNFQYNYSVTSSPILSFYCKLFTDNGTYDSRYTWPQWFSRGPGNYQWRIELWIIAVNGEEFKKAQQIISFNVQFPMHVKNTMEGGTLSVDGTQKYSGDTINRAPGDVVTFQAINQTYGGIYRLWNTTGAALSNWQQQSYNQSTISNISGANQSSYSRTISSSDAGMTIYCDLKRRFDISRDEQSEFDGTSSAGVVSQIVESNSGTISAPATKTLSGRAYNFAGWTDGDTTNPRTITQPTANTTYTAFYKYPNHTNYSYTMYFNNQRKFTRTTDTTKLYKVYESANKVWLEVSTNNGSTWTIANHGMPLNSTGYAKCASIASYGSCIGIVYQQQSGYGFKIMLRFFYPSGNNLVAYGPYEVSNEIDELYSLHANPVLGWGYNGKLLIVYEKKYSEEFFAYPGLKYYYGSSNGTNITWYSDGFIPGTDENSRIPAIDCMQDPPGATSSFHVLWWQTTGPASCSVYYDRVQWNTNNVLSFSTPQNVSSDLEYPGSGNENLIAYMSDTPQFIWKSEMYDYEDGDVYTTYSTVVLKSGNNHWEFGDDSVWPSIVKNKDEDFYAFSWQAGNGNYQFATSDDFTINTIGTCGYAAQLCPGSSLYNMYLLGLGDDAVSMYHFTNSNSLGSYYYKAPATGSYVGRFADINIKGTTFRLGLSDILVDNKSIDFVPIRKDDKINSLVQMNSVLESQPFELNNSSTFDYSVVYKFADTLKAKTALGDNGYLKFKVELVDAASGKVLGTYDTLTYNKSQVRKRSLKAYEVSTNGIGNKTVRLRMVISSNADITSIEAVQKYSTTSAMSKRSKKSIAYNGSAKVTDYAVSQNYPNPFNPSTMINYQIPKGGFVSLKVYDINGNEVANLVNETKEPGNYGVEFNARNLASGVYFYRIISGDFVQTKKMAILK